MKGRETDFDIFNEINVMELYSPVLFFDRNNQVSVYYHILSSFTVIKKTRINHFHCTEE